MISIITAALLLFCSCAPVGDVVDYHDELIKSGGVWYAPGEDSGDADLDVADGSELLSQEPETPYDASQESAVQTAASASAPYSSAKNSAAATSSKKQSSSSKTAATSKTTTTTTSKAATTTTTTTTTTSSYTPTYFSSNTKAVWISQWNLQSVFSGNKTKSSFETAVKNIFKKAKDYGFNTVIVQLRPYGDAFYPSNYYPWSYFVTGTVDNAPSFDPTDVMVSAAHTYGLSFHAWLNPLRLGTTDKMNATSSKWQTKKWYTNNKGDYVVQSGSYWYLNPAYEQTRQLVINGAVEIMQKYKVDALHIDDYFYPTTAASFDATAYKSLGGGKTLKAWRTDNINKLVKGIYSAIKAKNSKIKFGISPAGNIDNCVYDMYADVITWGKSSGYMDYCMPQIYYGYKHNSLDYLKCLNRWKTTVTNSSIQLIPGLAAYKIGYTSDGGSNEWSTDNTILQRQVQDAKSVLGSRYGGFAIFDYDSIFSTAALNTAQRNNLAKVIK